MGLNPPTIFTFLQSLNPDKHDFAAVQRQEWKLGVLQKGYAPRPPKAAI